MMSGAPLPKFDNPPVVEVALAIAFEPLDRFTSAHVGALWEPLRGRFPLTEDRPELPFSREEHGPAPPPRLELVDRPRVRTWFHSADGTQLLQLQRDGIAYNWKRGPASDPYPSYDEVERRFRDLLPVVTSFVEQQRLGAIVPVQVEVTYVNHIREPHAQIAQVFTLFRQERKEFLPPAEDARFRVRYEIPAQDDKSMLGRLTVDLEPAYITATREPILKLNMIARGRPVTANIEGALAFLRIGHEWIVRGFAEITTPEMHAKWDRRQ